MSLNACVSYNYVQPVGVSTATIRAIDRGNTTNNPVMVHNEKCSDSSENAQLVGLLNSKAIGTPQDLKAIDFKVEANKKLSLSMMVGELELGTSGANLSVTIKGCRNIIEFVPEENQLYEVEYLMINDMCHHNVTKKGKDGKPDSLVSNLKIREDCKLPSHWAPM